MNSSNKTLNKQFIDRLKTDYPTYGFNEGDHDHWSPGHNTITYGLDKDVRDFQHCVLHELAHAELGHKNYSSDVELLKLESSAWDLASKIGRNYGISIPEEHIQHCLDTYRDWLHRRSACPDCGLRTLQVDPTNYECYNCHKKWAVSTDRFSRSYRKTKTV